MPYVFNDSELLDLQKNFDVQIKNIARQTMLFRDTPHKKQICYVVSGMIYLCTENDNAKRHIIQLFRPGTFFITSNLPYIKNGLSYFFSKYDTTLAIIPEKDFPKVLIHKPDLSARLFEESTQDLLELGFAIRQNSLQEQLMLYFQKESSLQHSSTIDIPIPFSDLAEHLGVDRTALMKKIKELHETGIISGKGRHITLLKTTPQ